MLEVIESPARATEIADDWNRLVASQSRVPEGLGPTSWYELVLLTKSVHAPEADLQIYVTKDKQKIHEILPCFALTKKISLINCRQLTVIPDLYPGRTGPITQRDPDDEEYSTLKHVLKRHDNWDFFEATFVAGTGHERMFLTLVKRLNLTTLPDSSTPYPYMKLPDTWDKLSGTFSKKFRYNLRAREKKLRAVGNIVIRCYQTSEDAGDFFEAVECIERQSWKEKAGTSLTRNKNQLTFHKLMAPICANLGMFRGYVMHVDDEPVAHIIGLYSNDTFYCLKSSFVDSFRKLSPGLTLKTQVMKELIADGARYWDFVGPAEDHKMQWTSLTYSLNKYIVFAPGIKGTLLGLRWRLMRWFRNKTARRT